MFFVRAVVTAKTFSQGQTYYKFVLPGMLYIFWITSLPRAVATTDKHLLSLICLLILNSLPLGAVVTDKHLIPEGDLFQHSSCPHFFMEILIYSVYCAMFWWRHTVCNSVGLFVLVNQLLAGHLAHRWYQENFPNYPRERTPVIPLVHYSRLAGVPPPKKKKC